ncbi:MAG: nicotinate-nucleotide adenylyltransferase [Candidatus Omnitrophica bacterium]|nr:nicotinate-nucleotide adenylyltransferase [Candidatus Omnitrophota bacterium]
MRLGILGGTFDPFHWGHLTLARNARDQFSLDKVIFIPTYDPPHKREAPPRASAADRYAMVRLGLQGEPSFEASDLEIQRKGPSYSYDTIAELEKIYLGAIFFLVLGKDTFKGLETWHRAGEIKRKVRFLVGDRSTHGNAEIEGAHVEWIRMPLCPVSASGIREDIAKGKIPEDQLPPSVFQFIRDHHLYREIS